MKTLNLTKKYALIEYKKATLEFYNPSIVLESDSIEELETLDVSDYIDQGPTIGCTIVEKSEKGLVDYYTGEEFFMNEY